ncbi:hypothetical protein NL676_023352 [Syzygium grande]|nr:hypothetical protein NL676_023352 [Syzygium grande]
MRQLMTNHRDHLDPALLRPGRMDLHIHMSYCSFGGFKTLASNYLGTQDHPLFEEVEELPKVVQATPAEIAGKLMKTKVSGFHTSRSNQVSPLQERRNSIGHAQL